VSRPALGPTQRLNQWVPGALSQGIKWPGREADHSPSSDEVKEYVELYLHSPQNIFMAWCLVKQHRYNFTFTSNDTVSWNTVFGAGGGKQHSVPISDSLFYKCFEICHLSCLQIRRSLIPVARYETC